MSFLFGLLLLFCSILHSFADYDCRWETENATFDLCPLQLRSTAQNIDNKTYYEIFANGISSLDNFTYIFNVCNNIESRPPDEICWNNTLRTLNTNSMPIGYCPKSEINETDGECIAIEDITQNTAAYVIHRGRGTQRVYECYRMHNGIDKPLFSYINPEDPAIGVRITYINGDWCETVQRNRQFSLEFYCSETRANIPHKKGETVYETEECSYVLPIYTSDGCPQECPISESSNTLCDGNGVCEFDFSKTKPRCYCYYGFCGDDCSQTGAECTKQDALYNETTSADDPDECLFAVTDSFGIKAYYNLSYFNLNDEDFVVDDALDREYVYKFNICGDLERFDDDTQVPASCRNYNHGPCTHYHIEAASNAKSCDNWYDTFDSQSTAKAVQIFSPNNGNKSEELCYWLGMGLPDGFETPSYDVSLIDPNDSGRGVVFKILNGQYCQDAEANRELNVILRCPDTRTLEFDPYDEAKTILNESVDESETCVYEIEFESPLACPDQCISKAKDASKFAVCSSHGICVSDPRAKQVRCICDDGYIGMVCENRVGGVSTTTKPANGGGSDKGKHGSGSGWGVGIGICILIVVLMIVGGYCHQERKKRLAVNRYGHLQSDVLIDTGSVE